MCVLELVFFFLKLIDIRIQETSNCGNYTIEELIAEESKTIVYKSLYGLAPQYLCHLFVRNSAGTARALRNTYTEFEIPKTSSVNGQKCFSNRGVNYGTAYQQKLRQHLLSATSKF